MTPPGRDVPRLWPFEIPGGSVAGGRDGDETTGQQRLIFPLLAEPTPRPPWVQNVIVGTVILAVLSIAVFVAASQVRAASAGKLAVGMAGLDGRQAERTGTRGRSPDLGLEPGTCLREYEGGSDIRQVPVVSCDVEHRAEVVARLRMPESVWPGSGAVDEFASAGCIRPIRIAVAASAPALRWSYLGPSGSSWDVHDDRIVACMVNVEEPVIGSLMATS